MSAQPTRAITTPRVFTIADAMDDARDFAAISGRTPAEEARRLAGEQMTLSADISDKATQARKDGRPTTTIDRDADRAWTRSVAYTLAAYHLDQIERAAS